jgi:plant cysteine oxidase
MLVLSFQNPLKKSTFPVVLPSEVNSSEVVWLEELEDHLPPEGFVVARGLYKGPIIRK